MTKQEEAELLYKLMWVYERGEDTKARYDAVMSNMDRIGGDVLLAIRAAKAAALERSK